MVSSIAAPHLFVVARASPFMVCEQSKSTILEATKTIFECIADDPDKNFVSCRDQLEIYMKARDIEAENRDEYRYRAKSAQDPKVRALFELVCSDMALHRITHETIHITLHCIAHHDTCDDMTMHGMV